MDSVSRLIACGRWLVLLCGVLAVLAVPRVASAAGTVNSVNTGTTGCAGIYEGTPPASDPAYSPPGAGWATPIWRLVTVTSSSCSWGYEYNSPNYSWSQPYVVELVSVPKIAIHACPANSSPDGWTTGPGSCTCSVGFTADPATNACVAAPNACAPTLGVALTGEVSVQVAGQIVPGSVCQGSCTYVKTFEVTATWTKLAGVWTWRGAGSAFIGNGVSCTAIPTGTGSPTDPGAEPDPTPPPKGMCEGTVNGVTVIVACDGTATSSGPSGPGSAASGPATTASSPAGTAPNTSGVGTTTSCANGVCVTTTTGTTNNPDGTTTTTVGTETKDKGTYCKDNPGSPNCKDLESAFSGGCGGALTCEGDAVMCAIARDQIQRNCLMDPDSNSGSVFNVAAAAGKHPSDHPYVNGTEVPVGGSNGGFDTSNILSGSCPADQSFQVAGGWPSVNVPFSKLCGPAELLGNILVGITALACLGIVFVRGA